MSLTRNGGRSMTKLGALKKMSAVFLFCAATAITVQAQTFTTLVNFNGVSGAKPLDAIIQGTDGNFYGTTHAGGTASACIGGCGTVFQMTSAGALTTRSFDSIDGARPFGSLIQATDGNFYGTTAMGGNERDGTVFQMTSTGALATRSLDSTDGSRPYAGLIQAADGNFYGTTDIGGAIGLGTVFRVTSRGKLTTLYSFCSQRNCTDGQEPAAGLVQATDGNFYGTTNEGGTTGFNGAGTVFKITPEGALTTLYNFCSQPGCADGLNPTAGLIQAADGNFYGTTGDGGAIGYGTVFEITPGGTLTTLHSFGVVDGDHPYAGLVQGTDGNFYGTTFLGGPNGQGTVFEITPGGELTTLHSFNDSDGSGPYGGLFQGTTGNFYGTTYQGGGNNRGTVFSLSVGLGPFVAFVRAVGRVGQTAEILGQGLTGTTNASLNGTPAAFTVVSDTFIRATVPPGATTGYVTVTTPSGTLTSNVRFHVIP
jgi:uncharacterized repeat protein (TIGR03803 family)